MTRYFFGRLLSSILVILLLSLLLYALLGLMPGDPLETMLAADPRLTPEDVARMKAVYGLDKPLLSRYFAWLGAVFHGDMGYSRLYNRPVLTVLTDPLLTTLKIMLPAFVIALVVAVSLALAVAARPSGLLDKVATFLAMLSIAVPTFWLGIVLILIFAVHLGWVPASVLAADSAGGWWGALKAYILPVFTIAFGMFGGYLRYLRGSLRAVLPMPYLKTARAKGATRRRVLFRHALQNAALPMITLIALSIGGLFTGAMLTETLFGISGLGRLIYEAVQGNDYNLALAALLLAAFVVLMCNLLADLAYAWVDPRIRYGGA